MPYSLCLDTGDVNSAVQNLTVLSVNPTSITVGWIVSLQSNISGHLSYCGYISFIIQRYTFPPGASYTGFQLQYTDSDGYTQTASTYSYGPSSLTQYTLNWLQFGEEYYISVHAFFQFSGSCYSYIYSGYSNNVSAITMETGGLRKVLHRSRLIL